MAGVLFAITALLLYGCYLLVEPFLPAFAWALAFAVVAHPVHRWIMGHVRSAPWAAGLAVLLVAVVVVVPSAFVIHTILGQATSALERFQSADLNEQVQTFVESHPRLQSMVGWAESQVDLSGLTSQLTGAIGKQLTRFVGGSASGMVSMLISFFLLFYFLRDREAVMGFIRSLLPLSQREATEVLARVRDTVFASVYGTLFVASVQGTLGGLMFWWLGLPAPLLWGVIMGLLSIIPVLGSFVIWIPAAVFLALQGSWGKAALLAIWGTVVIGLIDNLLYPIFVGSRMRLHTVPVFIAIVGGLFVFGPSGVILGPVILALTDAAIEVWRCRTSHGGSAAAPC